jgi:type 1 glutamine amidotransferase
VRLAPAVCFVASFGLALMSLSLSDRSIAQDLPKRKLLFLTHSAGFQHSAITRPKDKPDDLSHAEKILTEIGAKAGIEVSCTKDCSLITAENLKKYDAVFFYTTGDLPIPKRQDLLDYVKSGKGFIGSHCATDTFHGWKDGNKLPYIELIGAEFATHHAQEESRVEVVDPKFPAAAHIPGTDFRINDEWYVFKNMSPDIKPVLVLDTKSMKQEKYNTLAPYPIAWRRDYGKGRVFYTGMGHREDVWTNSLFQQHVIAGIRWAMGDLAGQVVSEKAN